MAYRPKTQPRAHQVEGLARVRNRPNHPSDANVFAWLMDMGTGKTKQVLDEWGEQVEAGELHDLLVFAPAGSYRNWDLDREGEPSEITKHLDPALNPRVAAWVSGGGVAQKRRLEALLSTTDRPRILVVNIEALSSVQAARDLCEQFLNRRAMVAVDEATTIKNPTAARTKSMLSLAPLAAARRIMTGLLTPQSPMDMFSQFEFLDWRILGHKSYYSFRNRYAILRKLNLGPRTVQVEVGYRNLGELHDKIAPYSYRVLKEECLDLEPKTYVSRDVGLTPEQKRIYTELREFATAALGEETHVTATLVITKMLRLHQLLCGHVVDELGNAHDVPERRTAELVSVLDEHRGKAIIWVPYERTLLRVAQELRNRYGEGSVALFWGGNRSSRGDEEHRFKSDPNCRFMLSTQGAGGRGNTWVVADLVVYYGNTPDLEQRSQSEDRAHRDGQTRPVTYVDLIARGTVDERLVKSLRRKINLATAITGENYREWLI